MDASPPAAGPMKAAPGTTVAGRYVLGEEVASGGMASVYIGQLVGPVGFSRTVAQKRRMMRSFCVPKIRPSSLPTQSMTVSRSMCESPLNGTGKTDGAGEDAGATGGRR